jgi:hypothetical protein
MIVLDLHEPEAELTLTTSDVDSESLTIEICSTASELT